MKGNAVPSQAGRMPGQAPYYVSEDAPAYSTCASRRSQFTDAGYQERSASPEWETVLETMATEIKVRHYSRKTLKTYALWSCNFQRFLQDKPPMDLTTEDAKEYLSFLAVKSRVAASTQNHDLHPLRPRQDGEEAQEPTGFLNLPGTTAQRCTHRPSVLNNRKPAKFKADSQSRHPTENLT
jgi:hypothetical protein